MITEKLEKIVKDVQSEEATACVIWLHGLGSNGDDFADSVPDLKLPTDHKIRFIFPHAPRRAVTLNRGLRMPAWYDIYGLDSRSQEDAEGIEYSYEQMRVLIEEQHQRGIAYNRIFLIGFSQGGAISLYTGLNFTPKLGGVAALSSYLPLQYKLKKRILSTQEAALDTSLPIFMAHGLQDEVVTLDFGEKSRALLESLGFKVEWHTYGMTHTVSLQELNDLGQWLVKHLS